MFFLIIVSIFIFVFIFKREQYLAQGRIDPGVKEYINSEESKGKVISTVFTRTTR